MGVCQPVTRSREIVRMRLRPGDEERETVERRWRDRAEVVDMMESLRMVGEMEVDVAVDIVMEVM